MLPSSVARRTTPMTTPTRRPSSGASSPTWEASSTGRTAGLGSPARARRTSSTSSRAQRRTNSGLCAAGETTRRRFAADLLNLTLASPTVNRAQKSGKDAAGWLPERNRCWFANRVVEVRRTYALTIDDRERDVLEGILASCASTALIVGERSAEARPAQRQTPAAAKAPCSVTTTTRTAGSHARRHGATASPPYGASTLPTRTWTTATTTGWCANDGCSHQSPQRRMTRRTTAA